MTVLEQLARGQEIKLSDLARGNTRLGRLLQREGVPETKDLARVLALPQRIWETDAETTELVELLSAHLRAPGGQQMLHPPQAVLLRDLFELGGAFGALKVGVGKTLVSILAAVLLGSKRPLLLIPGGIENDTRCKRDCMPAAVPCCKIKEIAKHWRVPKNLTILSYEKLSLNQYEHELDRINPDLIVPDEGHALKNLDAGCSRRIERFLASHDECKLLVMSASLFDGRGIMDYHHLMRWTLQRKMPLPLDGRDALVWARALDRQVKMSQRMDIGALKVFDQWVPGGESAPEDDEPEDDVERTRLGFEERVMRTPGVVITREPGVASSLQISLVDAPNPCRREILAAYNGHKPNGDPLEGYEEISRVVSQLSLEFYYLWDRPAPAVWLDARKKWHRLERLMRDWRQPSLDTEHQVELYCAKSPTRIEDFERWRAVRDMFQPVNVPQWLGYDVIDHVAKTVRPGTLIWTHWVAPGEMLQQRHGLRYFREGGLDSEGRTIESMNGQTCVVSIDACGICRNLQAWHRNLVLTPEGDQEQLIGRTHRQGQKADTVFVEYLAHTENYRQTMERARTYAPAGSRLKIADWIDAAGRGGGRGTGREGGRE